MTVGWQRRTLWRQDFHRGLDGSLRHSAVGFGLSSVVKIGAEEDHLPILRPTFIKKRLGIRDAQFARGVFTAIRHDYQSKFVVVASFG